MCTYSGDYGSFASPVRFPASVPVCEHVAVGIRQTLRDTEVNIIIVNFTKCTASYNTVTDATWPYSSFIVYQICDLIMPGIHVIVG